MKKNTLKKCAILYVMITIATIMIWKLLDDVINGITVIDYILVGLTFIIELAGVGYIAEQ